MAFSHSIPGRIAAAMMTTRTPKEKASAIATQPDANFAPPHRSVLATGQAQCLHEGCAAGIGATLATVSERLAQSATRGAVGPLVSILFSRARARNRFRSTCPCRRTLVALPPKRDNNAPRHKQSELLGRRRRSRRALVDELHFDAVERWAASQARAPRPSDPGSRVAP